MKTYQEFISRLFAMKASKAAKYTLDNCLRLYQLIGKPDHSYACIHVAGTNGKGSVCTKLASALQVTKKKVGLFTSPHISCYRERIQVNHTKIAEEDVLRIGSYILELADKQGIPTTFFEVTTLMALLYYKEQNVDWAVLEVGLGGRLDATNVIEHPRASVITSISLDHTHILGKTVEEIAKDKGGIIKEGVPIIIGSRVPEKVIEAIAAEKQAPCYVVRERPEDTDEENAFVARKVLDVLGFSAASCAEALKNKPPCRFEHMGDNIILDVAHNQEGIQRLFDKIRHLHPHRPLRVVCGFTKTKDAAACIDIIKGFSQHLHFVTGKDEQCMPADSLASLAKLPQTPSSLEEEIATAITLGQHHNELIVICGSFYIMDEARKAILRQQMQSSGRLKGRG